MNIRQAQTLKHGDIVHYTGGGGCGSTMSFQTRSNPKAVVRYRVTGKPETWKRSPQRVRVPVKFGLYTHSAITDTNLADWHLESQCPLRDQTLESDSDAEFEFLNTEEGLSI